MLSILNVKIILHFLILLCFAVFAGCSDAPVRNDSQKATHRVISLAPNITEIVCAIGAEDLLVGRTDACDYPIEIVKNIPVIGSFGKPSLELIMSLAPTLILETDLADEAIGKRMDQLGLPRKRISCRTLHDIPVAIEKIGRLLDREKRANKLAEELRVTIGRLREKVESIPAKPSVYLEIWHDPMTTMGENTFLSELLTLAGGENIAADVDEDYFTVSSEWVMARNPDVIMCLYMSRDSSVKNSVKTRTGWQHLNAVRDSRVYDGFDNGLLLRPGPRFPLGVEAVRAKLSAEAHP